MGPSWLDVSVAKLLLHAPVVLRVAPMPKLERVVQECAEKKDWLGGTFEGAEVVCRPPILC